VSTRDICKYNKRMCMCVYIYIYSRMGMWDVYKVDATYSRSTRKVRCPVSGGGASSGVYQTPASDRAG